MVCSSCLKEGFEEGACAKTDLKTVQMKHERGLENAYGKKEVRYGSFSKPVGGQLVSLLKLVKAMSQVRSFEFNWSSHRNDERVLELFFQ